MHYIGKELKTRMDLLNMNIASLSKQSFVGKAIIEKLLYNKLSYEDINRGPVIKTFTLDSRNGKLNPEIQWIEEQTREALRKVADEFTKNCMENGVEMTSAEV